MRNRKLLRGIPMLASFVIVSIALLVGVNTRAQEPTRSLPTRAYSLASSVYDGMKAEPSDLWAVELQPGADPAAIAASVGFELVDSVAALPNIYVFQRANTDTSLTDRDSAISVLSAAPQIRWFEQQYYVKHEPRGIPTNTAQEMPLVVGDPLYGDQWHLENNGQFGGTPGQDANVQPAWDLGYNGTGIQIVLVDDGIEYTHPDLAPNYTPIGSYDINYGDDDPLADLPFDTHGTSVAGVAAARDESTCGVGVAYRATIAGVRLISDLTTDAMDANGLFYRVDVNDISSNSWGPSDNGSVLGGIGPLALAAVEQGALIGRGGLGTVYVWAGGNGFMNGDYANADAFVNLRYTIGVAAVDNTGVQSWYSEEGAALHVAAPSNGDGSGTYTGITTTDRLGDFGYNGYPANPECTNGFGGTSSAAPLVSGVVALMLQANPALTWRDVQHILAETAIKNDPTDDDWTWNAAGYHINHKYGFGRVDAFAAVNMARTWVNVSPDSNYTSPVMTVNAPIPDGGAAVTQGVNVSVADGTFRLEHVVVRLNVDHAERGDLEIILTSPSGTESVLLVPRPLDTGDHIVNYDLMTVRNWGEDANGVWTLSVRDADNNAVSGVLKDWKLTLYGNTGSLAQQVIILDDLTDVQIGETLGGADGIQVGLFDRHGVPLTLNNVQVNLELISSKGIGTLLGTTTAQTVNGVATFPNVRISVPGDYIIRAFSRSYDSDFSDPFTIYQPITGLIFSVQPTNTVAGSTINAGVGVRVILVDNTGLIISSDGVPITLSIANNAGGGTLSGTLTANTVNGVAVFNDLSIDAVGNGYTLKAETGAFSATSTPFNIYRSDLSLRFEYDIIDDVHFNQIIEEPYGGLIVYSVDSNGNLVDVDGVNVTITSDGPGTLFGTTTLPLTDGVAFFDTLYLNAPGTHTLTASAGGWLSATTHPFEVTTLTGQFCASNLDADWTGSLPILDNDYYGTYSTLTIPPIPGDPLVDTITVTIDAEHTYVGDIEFYLEHEGEFTLLFSPPANCSGNDVSMYLDDAALLDSFDDCNSGANPTQAYVLGESYIPWEPLWFYSGTSLSGDWTLYAVDYFSGDDGFVYEWCINSDLPASELAFMYQPDETPLGEVLYDTQRDYLRVVVQDVSGTIVPVDGVPITLKLESNPTGASLIGTTTVNTVHGVALFTNVEIDRVGTYTLRATSPGLLDVVSDPFDVVIENLIENGDFANNLDGWNVFDAITWQVTGETFEFYRNTGGESAVVFQDTEAPMDVGEVLLVELDLGNSSAVRKRVSVLVHNPNFSDLQICSFWLAPNSPMATYRMHLSTPTAWTSAVLSIYGGPADGIGWIQVDNVGMYRMPGAPGATETLCIDPNAPTGGAGADSANLILNGTFTGTFTPWGTFGAIVTQLTGDVAEMYRTFGTPAGSLLQDTGVPVATSTPIEIQLDLGNSSPIRQRAVVIVHSQDFSDLQVCVFWLEPGSALETYVIRTYTTSNWSGLSFSLYPSPAVDMGWIRMDNVSAVLKPTLNVNGTECYMPGSAVAPLVAPTPVEVPPIVAPQLPGLPPELPVTAPMQPAPEFNSEAEGTIGE